MRDDSNIESSKRNNSRWCFTSDPAGRESIINDAKPKGATLCFLCCLLFKFAGLTTEPVKIRRFGTGGNIDNGGRQEVFGPFTSPNRQPSIQYIPQIRQVSQSP